MTWLPCLVALVAAWTAQAAPETKLVPFKALESRKLLVKSDDKGNLAVTGYAMPPTTTDHPMLPNVDTILVSADSISIINRDAKEVADAVSRGEYDVVLVPVTYQVDGISSGRELAGFIRMEFITPTEVNYGEPELEKGKKKKAPPVLDVRTVVALRDPMGVAIKEVHGFPEVSAVAPNSPFAKAGVVPGDRLTYVNGVAMEGRTAMEAIDFMRTAEFPRMLTFLRTTSSEVDMAGEMPDGSYIAMEPNILAGWGFPFNRALFGTLPGCDPLHVVHATPTEGCRKQPRYNATLPDEDVKGVLLAARGVCKFEDKAYVAEDANLMGGVIVSNSKDATEMTRMPISAAAKHVTVPAVMIPYAAGRVLLAAKAMGQPIILIRNSTECLTSDIVVPTRPKMPAKTRRFNPEESKGLGVVFVYTGGATGEAALKPFEFLVTKYGPVLSGGGIPLAKLVKAIPEDGCVPQGAFLANAAQIAGNIAVMKRGTCMFPDKTYAAQAAKAIALIVINTDKNLLRVPAPPELQSKSFKIPTVLVGLPFGAVMPEYSHQFEPMARMMMHDV